MCRDASIIFTVRCHLEAELVLVYGAGAGLLSHLGAVLASASAGVALETGLNSRQIVNNNIVIIHISDIIPLILSPVPPIERIETIKLGNKYKFDIILLLHLL